MNIKKYLIHNQYGLYIIWMFKYFALTLDCFLALCYQLTAPEFSIFVLLPPILHFFTFSVKPHCFMMHCKPTHSHIQPDRQQKDLKTPQKLTEPLLSSSSPSPTPFNPYSDIKKSEKGTTKKKSDIQQQQEYQPCKQCGLSKWVRMHHCYYCNVCVHKYDHHCILLGICIGQANQKYYLPFLWVFLYSCVVQAITYFGIVDQHIWMDQNGYQHTDWAYVWINFAIIFFVVSIVVVSYLAVYHTYLGLHNNTTYQMRKRPQIYYFRGIIKQHPFDKGIIQNLKLLITASQNNPIEWERPARPKIMGFASSDEEDEGNIFEVSRRNKERKKQNAVEYHYINLNNIQL